MNHQNKAKEILKCHHQAPLWNYSFVIYDNSFCSAVLKYVQLGRPAGLLTTSSYQGESCSPYGFCKMEGKFFFYGCHPDHARPEDGGKKMKAKGTGAVSASAC